MLPPHSVFQTLWWWIMIWGGCFCGLPCFLPLLPTCGSVLKILPSLKCSCLLGTRFGNAMHATRRTVGAARGSVPIVVPLTSEQGNGLSV